MNTIAPTTAELLDAFERAGLWRIGMTFAEAQAAPLIRWALEKSALARRRTQQLPAQPRLI
jgi:hypothetical protein